MKKAESGWLKQLTGSSKREEKARLEAFLDAAPQDYCGWSKDGSAAFSKGFCDALNLQTIHTMQDIQNALAPSDAAALETLFTHLQKDGKHFETRVRDASKTKLFKLTGRKGHDSEGGPFDVIWLDDITDHAAEIESLKEQKTQSHEERDRLQNALDNLPLPLWLRDAHANLTWCNKAYAQIADNSVASVMADQIELSIKPAKKNGMASPVGKALAQQAIENRNPQYSQGHIVRHGKRHYFEVTETPLPAGNHCMGMGIDRTKEYELETDHKRYMAANNELLEQLGTAIGIFDAEQQLEFYNTAFGQLWHLEDSYLNRRPKLGDLMEKLREARRLPEQADFRKFKQSWLGMFTGLIGTHDEMLHLPDGSALRMLVVPHPMGGLMMTFEDVTSRLELESSYNTLVAVQKETLDNLSEGVSVFGGDGRLKLWNPSFARLWELNPEELEGEPHINRLLERMQALFPKEDWGTARESIVLQALDRNVHEGQMTLKDKSMVAYSTVPLPDGGVLITHVDITDKIRVENALRERNAALEDAERVKIDFLANVSYQLRTPLNAIMGFADILENEYFGKLNDKQHEYTTGMQEASERLLSLINNILDLSSIEAGYMSLEIDKVAIDRIITDIEDLTGEWALKEKILLRTEVPETLAPIEADERRVKQILLNLMRNAITFTPEKGTIDVLVKQDKTNTTITIKDSGSGISPEDQERIFQPFERGQAANSNRNGTGLGLTLVKNIAELHGGSVSLESSAKKGTAVTISLPNKGPKAS